MDDKQNPINWAEGPLARWLGGITKPKTKACYKSAYQFYAQFTKLSASQLIDEAIEDAKKDPREKTDIVKQRLIGFFDWLMKEAPKRIGPRGKEIGKGVSSKSAHTYIGAVRSFYSTFGIVVQMKGRSRLPRPRVTNRRMILNNMDVKRVMDHTRAPRDRAMILVMFQSGMDVSTLCALKYGDVSEGMAKGEHPLKLDLQRPKTGVDYHTFLGKDSVEALKAYLNDLRMRGITLNPNSYLFLKEGPKALTEQGLTTNLVQNMMREVVIKSGFVDGSMNGKHFNPLGPHALRESFGSIMINKGVPDSIVDFWLGHEIGEMAEAYKRGQYEELRRMYLEREQFISISSGGETMSEEVKKEMLLSVWRDQARMYGIDPQKVRIERENLTAEEEVSVIQVEIKRFIDQALRLRGDGNGNSNHYETKVIAEKDLESYLNAGWEFQAQVNKGKAVVRRAREA